MVVQRFSEVARTIIFVDNLSLYPTVKKKFQNWLTVNEVIAKMRQHVFLDTVYIKT